MPDSTQVKGSRLTKGPRPIRGEIIRTHVEDTMPTRVCSAPSHMAHRLRPRDPQVCVLHLERVRLRPVCGLDFVRARTEAAMLVGSACGLTTCTHGGCVRRVLIGVVSGAGGYG